MESAPALARRLLHSITGPMWHGPALAELLDDATAADAQARLASHSHSIWELTLHMAAWAEIAAARMGGERLTYPSHDDDWPPVDESVADAAWDAARARLYLAYETLARLANALGESALDQPVAGQSAADRHTIREMLEGVVEHGAYHGGQVALMRRVRTPR